MIFDDGSDDPSLSGSRPGASQLRKVENRLLGRYSASGGCEASCHLGGGREDWGMVPRTEARPEDDILDLYGLKIARYLAIAFFMQAALINSFTAGISKRRWQQQPRSPFYILTFYFVCNSIDNSII
jgi:hypothetical protein